VLLTFFSDGCGGKASRATGRVRSTPNKMLSEGDMTIIRIQDTLDINGYTGGEEPQSIFDEIEMIKRIMVKLTADTKFRDENRDLYTRSVERFNKMFKVLLVRRDRLLSGKVS
jgi:hypothetical protein